MKCVGFKILKNNLNHVVRNHKNNLAIFGFFYLKQFSKYLRIPAKKYENFKSRQRGG